jgi:hypothetical protein
MKLEKTGFNKFSGYNYFKLADFLPQIQTICYELGMCGVVSFDSDRASLIIHDTDDEGKCITFYSPMSSAALKGSHDVQNLGAVETYLRRYLWVNAFEIVEHDAIDEESGSKKKTHSATDGALASLEHDDRTAAQKLAIAIQLSFSKKENEAGYELYAKETDADIRVAAWSLLDSKIRSAIKKMKSDIDDFNNQIDEKS